MIEYSYELTHGKWMSHLVKVNGITITSITDETPIQTVYNFVELCRIHEVELTKAVMDAEEKIKWNHNAGYGNGKNWPEFGRLERLKTRLAKQAGIVDS